MIKNFFKKQVKLVSYPTKMSEDESKKILAEQGEDSRIWQALDTIIDLQLLDAVNEVSDPKLHQNQLFHASGRIEAISTLKLKIQEAKKWRIGKMNYKTN